MTYSLGIDLGTTTCTVARREGPTTDICPLEAGATGLPSVALTGADGRLLVGRDADRHSPYEPPLIARYVQGRLGDPTPIEVDGRAIDPAFLAAALLRTAAERAAPLPGATPDEVVVTFPLGPGPAPEALLTAAANDALGPDVMLVPAPVAALARATATHDLRDDALVAVVDVGGATVDVAVLCRTPTAFDLVGEPATLADLGGVDFDAAVLALVEGAIGDVTSAVRADDRAGMLALRQVRAACRAAKEQLSTAPTATVDIAVPQVQGQSQVEVTREAFERMVEPALVEAADLVAGTVHVAGLTPSDLDAIVLVGGSARIPRITEVLAERLGRPVLCDDRPEATVALGATLFADSAGSAGVPGDVRIPLDMPGRPDEIPPATVRPDAEPVDTGSLVRGPAALPGLAALADIPPVGPTTGGGPLPWESDRVADDPAQFRATGGVPPQPSTPPADPWDHTDPTGPPPAAPHGDPTILGAAPADEIWGQTSDDQVRRLTTSDTDPFGQRSSGVLASLRRERQAAKATAAAGDEDDGALDRRFVLGGVAAAVVVLVVGCWLALAGLGGDGSDRITVADANSVRSTTSTTAPSTSSTEGSTTTESSTTTTEAPTTTADPRPTTTPTTEATPPPPPPTTVPPPFTSPPTTRPQPTTTTTRPPRTTTTTAAPATTTTSTEQDEGPPGGGHGGGNGGGGGGGGG
jgi:molecular chaperone DnaK